MRFGVGVWDLDGEIRFLFFFDFFIFFLWASWCMTQEDKDYDKGRDGSFFSHTRSFAKVWTIFCIILRAHITQHPPAPEQKILYAVFFDIRRSLCISKDFYLIQVVAWKKSSKTIPFFEWVFHHMELRRVEGLLRERRSSTLCLKFQFESALHKRSQLRRTSSRSSILACLANTRTGRFFRPRPISQ